MPTKICKSRCQDTQRLFVLMCSFTTVELIKIGTYTRYEYAVGWTWGSLIIGKPGGPCTAPYEYSVTGTLNPLYFVHAPDELFDHFLNCR